MLRKTRRAYLLAGFFFAYFSSRRTEQLLAQEVISEPHFELPRAFSYATIETHGKFVGIRTMGRGGQYIGASRCVGR